MNNLNDLVIKIDALTANSQQVLNALIRSCVASGSSSGYKVNKYGVEITLDRADIYHLYDFYQSWEAEQFPSDEESFNSLLARADERWRTGASDDRSLATEAVVKHAQILYLTKEDAAAIAAAGQNSSVQDNSDYWVSKIRESASPKGTVSSAPIPLNLRTPLYDENLSVKSFSQFETYLFPMGYHRSDILGTPGNGEDYVAGGRNWTLDASEVLTLSGRHIVLGENTNPDNKLVGYGTKGNNISWGKESYAFGDLSLSFGDHSISQADGSIVFGTRCYGNGKESFIAGGERDVTLGFCSFAANGYNTAVAQYSFAANRENYSGGWGYYFTFLASESNSVQTKCDVTYVESEKMCVANTNITEVLGDSSLYKVIRISGVQVDYACMPFDIRTGDRVVLYDLAVKNKEYSYSELATDIGGYAADPVITRVANVSAVYKTDTEGNPTKLDYYEITLQDPVPVTSKYGVFSGGHISLYSRRIEKRDLNGRTVGTEERFFGENSAVFGYANPCLGKNQTVTGQMSYPNTDAKFVVGVGSAYILGDSDIEGSPYRANGLVVSDSYGYMKLADGRSYIGLSNGLNSVKDKMPGSDTMVLFRGTVMKSTDPNADMSSSVLTDYERALLTSSKAGDTVARAAVGSSLKPIFQSAYPTAVLQSLQGTAVLTSGAYIEEGSTTGEKLSLVDTLLRESRVIRSAQDHGVAIYAQDGIDIRSTTQFGGSGINIEACSYITMRFRGLFLHGMTFGTLPATDNSQSFILNQKVGSEDTGKLDSIYWSNTVGYSGFYFIDGKNSHAKLLYTPSTASNKYDGTNIHLLNSGVREDNSNNFHIASLGIPEKFKNTAGNSLRLTVNAGTIVGVGGISSGQMQPTKEIPYFDEVSIWSCAPASSFGYLRTPGTPPTHSTTWVPSSAWPNNDVVMPVLTCSSVSGGWTYSGHYAKILPITSAEGSYYPYHSYLMEIYDGSSSKKAELSVSVSINGNHVDIYGAFTFSGNPGSGECAGYRVAFLPGFATQSTDDKFGVVNAGSLKSLIYKRKTTGSQTSNRQISYLSGEGLNNGEDGRIATLTLTTPNIYYGGMGIRPGILVVDILRVSDVVQFWDTSKPYGFHVHGIVPFEASGDCVGNAAQHWNTAIFNCYNANSRFCPYDLLTQLMEDSN